MRGRRGIRKPLQPCKKIVYFVTSAEPGRTVGEGLDEGPREVQPFEEQLTQPFVVFPISVSHL